MGAVITVGPEATGEPAVLDLSSLTDPETDVTAHVLEALDVAAQAVSTDYMVVGGTARNILSAAWFGRMPARATQDVDVAVAVPDWQSFHRLTSALTRHAGVHTFTVSVSDRRIEVDVIPYGGVEEPDRSVHLPNDHRLNVLGVREAFDAADTVLLPGGLEVRVPTIPGLALLKIIVWYDRRFLSKRDATDLDEIINWYSDGPFLDDLLEEAGILDVYDFDIVLAAAHRLGRHIGLIAGHEGRAAVLAVLDDDDLRARLTSDMGRATTGHSMRLLALADGIRCFPGR